MNDTPQGEWPPEGIPIEAAERPEPESQRTVTMSFTPDWYEASPLVKEWVDELCDLAGVPVINTEQIVLTFYLTESAP